MKCIVLSGYHTSIRVEKRHLLISDGDQLYDYLPHQIDVDQIIVDGHTGNISLEAIRWLMKHDINITVLNWNGNLLASINPKETNIGKLRVKQYSKHLDTKARYEIASKIIYEKVNKSLNLLGELSKYYDCVDVDGIKQVFESESKSKKGSNLNDIRTYEGMIAAIYWDNLSKIFNELYPEFNFAGRRNKSYSWNMNAADEINALLNYGYAVLESLCRKQVNTVGLDMCVGFLHEMDKSKTPLVYDLQELGRWIIDLSVIELLEEKKLNKSNFIVTENYHIRLKEQTAKMLIEKIQSNFNNRAKYKGKNYTYENILLDNLMTLAGFIQDKKDKLQLNVAALKIQRNDNTEVRDHLLSMTPEERRQLGINRNTLWYIKRNLREGKTIKVYDKVMTKIV